MTRLRQKLHERLLLECFIESLSDDVPAPAESFTDGENPDFILHQSSGQTLGIELTVLHHPNPSNSRLPLRQEEGIQEHICREVEQRWRQSGPPWSDVSIHFLGRTLPSKRDEPQVADALMEVIRRAIPPADGEVNIGRDDLWQHPMLGRLVQSISVWRWSGLDRPYVHASIAAFLPSLSHSLIQAHISKKNRRSTDYRKKCDEIWLVLVHNETGTSTHFDRRDLDLSESFQMNCDRVWLLDFIKKKVLEVGKVKE